MQKSLAIAAVMGAVIIAVALVYHGRQLAEVSRRLEAMEQRTTSLDSRLEKFSTDLPILVGQAGNNAGRQAVHGVVDELVQMPLNWLRPRPTAGTSNAAGDAGSSAAARDVAVDQGTPWIRFDIRKPVVKIEILPNLKDVTAIPPLPVDGIRQLLLQTNDAGNAAVQSKPDAGAK